MSEPEHEPEVDAQPAAPDTKPDARRKPAVKVTNKDKKFSVTIQVPEDVVERWPEWFAAEKLVGEVFKAAAVASVPARSRMVSRLLVIGAVVLVIELFIGGLFLGYYGGGWFDRQPAQAVTEPAPETPQAAEPSEPAAAAEPAAPPAETPSAEAPSAETTATATPSSETTASEPAASAAAPAAETAATPAPPAASAVTAPPAAPPAAAPAARPARVYRVQVGAFLQRINADQLVIRLRADGYRPVVRTSGQFLLVTIGSFNSRSGAERLAAQLRARRYDALVVP